MKQADILFTNAFVLTMDEQFQQFPAGAVAVLGDSIVGVGEEAELKQQFTAKATFDCGGKVLMPGLINAHTHAPMTLMRGLADDLRLDVWLMGYMMPVEREFVSPEFVFLGTQLACAEMVRGGTTCFADMFYYEDSVAEAASKAGVRAICAETILKFPSPDSPDYQEALRSTRTFIQKWVNHPLITPAVGPHAPYTTTPEILKLCAALATEFRVPIHTHLAETTFEVERSRQETGMPVIPYVKKQNLFDAKVIAAHCVHIDEGEMRALAHHGAGVVHNPASNLKLASGLAPVKKMLDLNVNVGIGTDGPASNNDLDMFEEIRLTALLAKLNTGDPTVLPARTAIHMATRGGARALHLAHLTGSIEIGKKADLITVDVTTLHNAPQFRRDVNAVYAQLVYASKSTDVFDVMVNGAWLMKDKQLLTLNEKELMAKAGEYAKKIDVFLKAREESVLSKLIGIGGAMEEESFEIQIKVRVKDVQPVLAALEKANLELVRRRNYREFDTYFEFEDPSQGRIRYREDEFIDEKGMITSVRTRLTLIGANEHRFPERILLSRSRYLAPAQNTLRFYREYFSPNSEIDIQKNRLRFLVKFQETEFFINIDQVRKPDLGNFVEIKSRTWSKQDAEQKIKLIEDLLTMIGAQGQERVTKDYIEMLGK